MVCENICCKFHADSKCLIPRKVKIGPEGCCSAFEKGVAYYTSLVFHCLSSSNMILPTDLSRDMKIGISYVMRLFDLEYASINLGPVLGKAYILAKNGSNTGLTTREIVDLPFNYDAALQIAEEFSRGDIPSIEAEEKSESPKKFYQPFGWLSPTGEFTEGDFGEHEAVAQQIVKIRGFYEEYRNESICDTARDFLTKDKGYVLIHNPIGNGGYIVSNVKPLTKKQREFLYEYFSDLGDTRTANRYMED